MTSLFEYVEEGQGGNLFQYEEDKPLFRYEEPRDVQLMEERRGAVVAPEEQLSPGYQKPAEITRAESAFKAADNASMPTHEEDVAAKERAFQVADNLSMQDAWPDKPTGQPDYGDYRLVQGSPVDTHRGSPFADTKAGSARAAMAVAIANEYTEAGTPTSPSEVLKHFNQYSKELGLRGTLTPTEYYGMAITGMVAHGGMQAAARGGKAVASLLLGFGVFEGIGAAKGAYVRGVTGDNRDHYLADMMDPSTNPNAKEFVKGLETASEFFIGAKAAHVTNRTLGATINKVKNSNWFRRATIRERGVMLSDVGHMIDGMKAVGKTPGQIFRQIRRTYGPDSPQWKEVWENYAVKTQRVPEQPKAQAKPTETKTAEKPADKPTEEPAGAPEPAKPTKTKKTDVKVKPTTKEAAPEGGADGPTGDPVADVGAQKIDRDALGDVNVKKDGTPYTQKSIRLVVNRKVKSGLNVEPVQIDDAGEQWGWREVVDADPTGDIEAQAVIREKLLKAAPSGDYDTMLEHADTLIDKEGFSVDDVYEVLNQIDDEAVGTMSAGGGGATTYADSGIYADIPPKGSPSQESMAMAAKKESVAGAGTGAVYEGKTNFESMELPELVHLHKTLMDGKLPKVMERMKARGSFNTMSELTRLNANIFKDTSGAAKTLAHEIGHIVDYLPDRIPGIPRGNILGRIVSAKKTYRKHFVEGFPGGPHPITPKEKAGLRRQIKRELRGGERYVDEVITKKLKVTPDDILSIWNSTMTPDTLKKEFPGLYDYVAKLDAKGKKALITAAMRGDLPERVQKFAKTITKKTGKKVKQIIEGTPEEVRAEFRKAVMAEVLARRLLDKNVVMDELKQFTRKWKPFDENADWKYTKYRYKPAELYADAFSALLTDPNRLAAEAPVFCNAFLNFLERKPKFAEVWSDLQREIRGGKSVDARRKRARESMRIKTAELLAKTEPPSDGFWEEVAIKMVDKAWRILKDVHAVGDVPVESNPYLSYENWLYSGSIKEGYQNDMMERVFKPLAEANIDPVTFSEYLRYRREVGERHSIANPGGETQTVAYEMLKAVVDEAGPAIEKAADAFWEVRKEWFIDRIEQSGMHSKELTDKIVGNEIYARFEVVQEETIAKYGEAFSGMIHGQVGTLQDIADPFLATAASDIGAMSTLFKMMAMRDTVTFYQQHYSNKIQPAKRIGKNRFAKPARNSGYGMIGYLEGGKAKAFYVPKNVARAFETRESNPAVMALYNLTLPFRKLFVDYNLGFALKNPIRDIPAMIKVLPGANLRTILPLLIRSLPESYGRARGRALSPAVRMMLHEGSLISSHEFRGRIGTGGTTEFLQNMFKIYDMTPDGNGVWSHIRRNRGVQMAARPLLIAMRELSYITQATEGMTKIAAHKWLLKNHPDMPKELRAHIVREAGSPRFLTKGELNTELEAFIPFYNPAKEGTRTQLRAARRDKWDYWQKTFVFNLGPRILMRLAKLGLLGGAMAAIMNRATEYDTSNYNIIPLGMEGNNAVYLRIPQDEFARLLLNIEDFAWRTATQGARDPKELLKIYSGMIDVTFSNAPGMNPALTLLSDTFEFISGGIPYDYFRGKQWFSESINRSQKRRWAAFARGAASRYGLKAYYDFEKQDAKTVTDKLGRIPILGPAFNAFIKKTDFGLSQAAEREWEKVEAMKGEDRLLVRDVFERWMTNDTQGISDEKKTAINRRFSNKNMDIWEEYYRAWMNRNGNSLERRLANAKSRVEQEYYKHLMARDPFYKPTDMTPFFESMIMAHDTLHKPGDMTPVFESTIKEKK